VKNRLPFFQTIVVALLTLSLIAAGGIWLIIRFDLPDWVNSLIIILATLSYYEVIGRVGPKPFETPLKAFSILPTQDKIVIAFAGLIWIIIALPIGMSSSSRWIGLAFMIFASALAYFICVVFGSSKLKESLRFGKRNGTPL
jgi:hypothetical protein